MLRPRPRRGPRNDIMPTEIKLEKFEGPLDLLLQLIEQEKMVITEVSLSQVTEQFLNYLDKFGDDRSENLADFLVIATRLVYLKSKQLLPYLQPEEEEGPSLADQLKLYKQYLEASQKIHSLWTAERVAYGRIEPPVKAVGFVLPLNARTDDLRSAFLQLIKRLEPISPLPEVKMDRTISIKQKIDSIRKILRQYRQLNFEQLLENATSRTEVIVSFLALLELVKDQSVQIKQAGAFNELVIKKI